MTFAITHDDGQSPWGINDADVCLVGVSRSSKTPTCLYLANRGIKAANVPFVPGIPLPQELLKADKPLIVGLTNDPERLIHLRRNRLTCSTRTKRPITPTSRRYAPRCARQARLCATSLAGYRRNPAVDRGTASSIYKLLMRRHGQAA